MKTLTEKSQIEILMAAFESSYDGIHILDKEGKTLYINSACSRIEGISVEDAMRKNIRELVNEGVYSESVTLKVLSEKKPITMIQVAQNGNRILVTGTPIYNGSEIDKVIVNSRDITELNSLREELEHLRKAQFTGLNVVSKSQKMQKIIRLADTVAKVDSTVLITGESGVGKGVISKFIHNRSSRSNGSFIKIDCSAIPETLFESELFGYEKGAFTGAEKSGKMGLLELGNGGTVFLDEIGEMPLTMQPKILRAIQDRQIVPVGGKILRELDVRIIAATNMNLKEMVSKKQFREDLYYRLNVIPIDIPPLRERKEDILPLINDVAEKINKRYGWNKKFSHEVINRMINHNWPGNVRELENFIERLMVSAEGDIIDNSFLTFDLLSSNDFTGFNDEGKSYKQLLAEFDNSLIQKAISDTGNIPKAAKRLGVDITTIRRKLKRYNED